MPQKAKKAKNPIAVNEPPAQPAALSDAALDALAEKASIELARRDLGHYYERMTGFKLPTHIREWADALMDDSIKNLLIIAPPGHAKSLVVGVLFPTWYLGHNPDAHIILLSNTATQAEKPSVAARDIIASSPEYKKIFPGVTPDSSKGWAQSKWFVKRKNVGDKDPSLLAAGAFGPILGARASLVLMDDLMDEEVARSVEQRKHLIEWVRNTVFTRRVKGAKTVIVLTRWSESDLASHFIGNPDWYVIHMPAIGYWGENTPLAAEIQSLDDLLKIRNDPATGSRIRFENIYQGNPTVQEGQILRKAWWRRMPVAQMPRREEFRMIIHTWDTAFKKTDDSAFSVCLTMGLFHGDIFILNMFRRKMEFPELLKRSRELYIIDKPRLVVVEDKASGQSLLQMLRFGADKDPDRIVIPLYPIKADSDPISYVNSFTGYLEAGHCWLPDSGPISQTQWMDDFMDECAAYPNGMYNDSVMAWAHGMKYLTAQDKFSPLTDGAIVSVPRRTGDPSLGSWDDLPGVADMGSFLGDWKDFDN